jgi:outer membrane protein TolC
MIRSSFWIFCFVFAFTTSTGWCQMSAKLDLLQAIEIGKERSLKTQEINYNYEAANYTFKAARSSLYTSFSLNGNLPGLNRQINQVPQPNGTILFVPTSQAYSNVTFLINQPIPVLGGSFWVGSNLARFDNFNTSTASWNASPVFFGLSLPLGSFNPIKWNWKNSKLNYKRSHSNYAESIEQLSIDITNAYFDFYIAKVQYDNSATNVSINDSIYKISLGRYNVGKIAENELLQVELSKINAEQLVSRQAVQKEIAEQRLKLLMGLNENESIILDTLPSVKTILIDIDKAVSQAKENSSIIIQNQIDLQQNLINMKQSSRARFPDGSLTATFGLNQSANTIAGSYSNPLNSQTASIGFSIPLFQFGNAQATYKLNKAYYDASVSRTEYLDKNLGIDVQQAVLEYQTYEGAVATAKLGYEIALKRYDVSKNRFLIGKIDITNLTIAQGEKDNALINYMNTLRNYWVAYFRLRKITLFDFETNEKLIVVPTK